MRKEFKTQSGITLVALIITIVVLLILAAVTIDSIQNDGIINKTQQATQKFEGVQLNEQLLLQDYEDKFMTTESSFEAYSIGDTVTVNGEAFYVIEDSSETQTKVLLLAKQNINTSTLVQSSSANTIMFSSTNYWSNGEDIIETTTPPDSSHYAAYAAYRYGAKLGGIGRLLKYSEASILAYTYSLIPDDGGNFWLGTATDSEDVIYGVFYDIYIGAYESDMFGVRPVVEISKSKIDTLNSGITNTNNVTNTLNTLVY